MKKKPRIIDMQKKVAVCLAALLLINAFLFAQLTDEADVISDGVTGTFEQALTASLKTQHIEWQSVRKAHGYAIELQKKLDGKWTAFDSYETDDPEFDFVLEPGYYRFRISALNIIGKKGNFSGWAEFELVEDSQPVLQRQSLPESERYGVPVLVRSIEDENGSEIIQVRGINCYTDDTSFSLVPVENQDLKPFTPLEDQKVVSLPVSGMDISSHTVNLSVDWSKLVPGYYDLLVEKKTGECDSFEVLVLPNRAPVLYVEDSYYNDILAAPSFNVAQNGGVVSFETESLQFDTFFSLQNNTADEKVNPYPFASAFPKQYISVQTLSYEDGTVTLQFDPSYAKPGWYSLWAETPDAGSNGYGVLIEADYAHSVLPEVTDVSAKIKQETQTIAITIRTDEAFFSEDNANQLRVFCISEKNEMGENFRQQMRMTSVAKNGKSAVFEMSAGSVLPGNYALMLETGEGARFAFITINSKFKADLISLSNEEVDDLFLRAPSQEILAAREAERAAAEESGLKMAEFLPAFETTWKNWIKSTGFLFPATVGYESGALQFAAKNEVSDRPYTTKFILNDEATLSMLRDSEGFSFESMVTGRNNWNTKWSLDIRTDDDDIVIPLNSKLKTLSQTIIRWEDYGIDPASVEGITYLVDAKEPHEAGWSNSLEIYNAKTYSSYDPVKALSFRNPMFLAKAGVFAALSLSPAALETGLAPGERMTDDRLSDSGVPSHIWVNIFNLDWFSINAVYAPAGLGEKPMFGGEMLLSIPNDWFEPYAGTGYMFNGKTRWEPFFAGVVLFKYINVRWTYLQKGTTLENAGLAVPGASYSDTVMWWTRDWLEVGVQVPIRKKIPEYSDAVSTESGNTSVFFTDFLAGIDILDSAVSDRKESVGILPDFSFGVRAVGLKHFAVDVMAGVYDFSIDGDPDIAAYNLMAGMKLQLPLFNNLITPFIGVDAGFLMAESAPSNSTYFSPSAGVKFGKYVTLSINGMLYDSDWGKVGELAKKAPVLAPISTLMCCNDWRLRLTISVPLRDK